MKENNLGNGMKQLRLIIAALFLITPFAASADLIVQDGSFEEGDSSPWLFSGNGKQDCGLLFGAGAHTGDCYAAFTTNNPGGSVSQQVELAAGTYELVFWLAQRGGGTSNTTVQILLGDGVISELIEITTASGVWSKYSMNFGVVTDSVVTLRFGEPSASINRGPILDDVSISSVPEPGTLALLGLGIAGMGMARRRKSD